MDYQMLAAKNEMLIQVLNRMLYLKERGKTIAEYFEKIGIKRIGIWGCSDLGQRVYDELRTGAVEIVCGIDLNPESKNLPIVTVSPNETNKELINSCEAIVLTPVFNQTDVLNTVAELGYRGTIYSIDKVLMEM